MVVLEPVSIVSVLEFASLSLVESELQADNSPTVRAEARITEINFFFINPPGIRSVSYLTYADVKKWVISIRTYITITCNLRKINSDFKKQS